MQFCPDCGTALESQQLQAHLRPQRVCPACGERRLDFPMVVVTCFIACGQRLLWMRRALDPKAGSWAIPGGFLESGETLAEGAARELREETGIELAPDALELYMMGSITFINQVYVAFRATVASDVTVPGKESLECRFYSRQDCPWGEVAYPEVNDVIEQAYRDLESGEFQVWHSQMTPQGYQRWAVSAT